MSLTWKTAECKRLWISEFGREVQHFDINQMIQKANQNAPHGGRGSESNSEMIRRQTDEGIRGGFFDVWEEHDDAEGV